MKSSRPLGTQADSQDRLARSQRRSFLSNRGINPDGPTQLDLAFPEMVSRLDLRHLPNDLARSSLFTIGNKSRPRKSLMQATLHHYSSEAVSILYTGTELRAQDDEIIFMQILSYASHVPMGSAFEFSIKQLVKDVGWPKNGAYYDQARASISRLKATELLVTSHKAFGKSAPLSLIKDYQVINDGDGKFSQYRMFIDPNLIVLFAGRTFTSHSWSVYTEMKPVERRLADWIRSHKSPFPLALENFKGMCGSVDTTSYSWRQTVRKACEAMIAKGVARNCYILEDRIHVHRDYRDK